MKLSYLALVLLFRESASDIEISLNFVTRDAFETDSRLECSFGNCLLDPPSLYYLHEMLVRGLVYTDSRSLHRLSVPAVRDNGSVIFLNST